MDYWEYWYGMVLSIEVVCGCAMAWGWVLAWKVLKGAHGDFIVMLELSPVDRGKVQYYREKS